MTRNDYRIALNTSPDFKPIVQMQQYMSHVMNVYCSEYSCNHFHRIWVKMKLFQNSWRIIVCCNKIEMGCFELFAVDGDIG